MGKGRLIFLFAVFLILASLGKATDISSCQTLSSPDTYTLTADILNSGATKCFDITADYVTLDCQGHTVDGVNSLTSYAVFSTRTPDEYETDIYIQNCVFTDWGIAIYFGREDYNSISNVNITSNRAEATGIEFLWSNNIYISNINAHATSYGNGLNGIAGYESNFSTYDTINISDYVYGMVVEGDSPILSNIVVNHNTAVGLKFTTTNGIFLNIQADSNGAPPSMNVYGYGLWMDTADYNLLYNISANMNGRTSSHTGIRVDTSNFNNFSLISTAWNTNYGMRFEDADSNIVDNLTSSGNIIYNLYLDAASNNTIFNSDMHSPYDGFGETCVGLNNAGDTSENFFYNNLFNCSAAFAFSGTKYSNLWNTTNQTGQRIVPDGPNIGGNFWAATDGTGYSQICNDTERDGFCDENYTLVDSPENVDFLPLSDDYINCSLRSLNVTTWDELTGQQIYFNIHIENATSSMDVSNILSFSESWCNASLPIGNVTVAISNSSYFSPRYYIGYIGNAILKAYLLPLNDSHAVLATFIVQDAGTSPAAGIQYAELDIYKDFGGILVLIAQRLTDSIGGATIYLDSQTQYVANASAVGYIPKTVAASFANSTTLYIPLNRIAYSLGFGAMFEDINYTLLPTERYVYNYSAVNASFLFSVTSKNGTLSNYGMNITNASGTLIFTGSGSNALGGSIPASINASQHSGYFNVTFWIYSPVFSPTPYVQTVKYSIYGTTNQTNLGGILGAGGLLATSGLSHFAIGLLAIIISLVVSGAFATFGFSVGQSGVLFTIVLTLFAAVGVLSLGLWIGLIMMTVAFVILRWL